MDSIIKAKCDHIIRLSATLTDDNLTANHLQSCVDDIELPPIPMKDLCPICFTDGDGSNPAFLCFDGNFQLTTLGTKLEKRDGISLQDLNDKRLFIEDEIPSATARVSNAVD